MRPPSTGRGGVNWRARRRGATPKSAQPSRAPARGRAAIPVNTPVSVFAPSAMFADALSTALYVTPPERGLKTLASYEAFPRS